MKYVAEVVRLDDLIEEYVLLNVEGIEVLCFADVCPYPIEIGGKYEVLLTLIIFDDYQIVECRESEDPKILNDGTKFSSKLIGKLLGDKLVVGKIEFRDDIFLSDYGCFNEKLVVIEVDRIGVEFL